MSALPEETLIALAKKYAAQAGVPASMIYAMIQAESTGHPDVVHGKTGARGLMQLMGPAAEEMGHTFEDMLDPDKNVRAGAGYIGKMLHRFKDPGRALSAYNSGPGATRKVEDVTPASSKYVSRVADLVGDVTQPGQPFEDEMSDVPLPAQTLQRQKVRQTIDDLLAREEQQPYTDAGIRRMLSQFNFNQ